MKTTFKFKLPHKMKRPIFAQLPLASAALLVSLVVTILLALAVGMPTGSEQTSNQLIQLRWSPTVTIIQRVRRETVAMLRQPTNSSDSVSKVKKEEPRTSKAGGALVGFVRLSLVILICVLLVKLHAIRRGQHGGGQRYDAREQKISGIKEENDISRTNSNELNKLIGTKLSGGRNNTKQQVRRHSQPATSQHNQQLERRRRHSDTTTPIASLQLPPGPMGLPFLGYLPFLGSEIHLTLTELSRKFGPIYQIFLGGIRVVVLNDASLVRQAFKQAVFSGRPNTQLTRILQGYGIVNSEGALWKEQRAFLHSALRKLGAKSLMSGSNGLEAKIQVSVEMLTEVNFQARCCCH